jgi:RimJ/RimL family protein N-acetyltransferase
MKTGVKREMADTVRLRPSSETDLEFVLKLEADSDTAPFIHAWPIEEHRSAIADSDVAHWIVEDTARALPVGFVILKGLGTDIIEFRRIAISEKGRGYGSHAVRLVKEAALGEMGARRIWLDVYDFNDRARAIYKAEGFETESERPASEACGGCAEGTAILMALERA